MRRLRLHGAGHTSQSRVRWWPAWIVFLVAHWLAGSRLLDKSVSSQLFGKLKSYKPFVNALNLWSCVARTHSTDAPPPHCDELHAPEALHMLLPRADFVVLATPVRSLEAFSPAQMVPWCSMPRPENI